MKRLLSILYICIFSSLIFANDYTDSLLDETIIEFSNKNYDRALILVETVLELEPNNKTALMYKQTIEDVISIDRVVQDELDEQKTVDVEQDQQTSEVQPEERLDPKDKVDESDHQGVRSKTLIGIYDDNNIMIEQGIRLLFGAPLVDVRVQSKAIEYDTSLLSLDTVPLDEIIEPANYYISGAIGYRYQVERSYFDLLLGAGNVSLSNTTVVPFLGFDSIFYIWDFTNIWVGAAGRVYSYNNINVNNFEAEVSTGISLMFIDLGIWYKYSDFESVSDSESYYSSYGLYLSVNI